MSAAVDRMPRTDALRVADHFVALLGGAYDRLEYAGSLRRRLPAVGDIEIVAVPSSRQMVERDLFGEPVTTALVDLLDARMETLADDGIVQPRLDKNGSARWGPSLKYLTFGDARIDLFTPCAERLGWILLLRTGPAAFSRQLVQPLGKRTRDGRFGLLPASMKPRDGWLTWGASAERIKTPEEADCFRLFGLPYTAPWERT